MSALQIKNTSESDPHSYEVTQLQIKPGKNFWGSNRIQTCDLHDTGVMLYQLSYMKPHWKQVKCEFNLYPFYEDNDMMCIW